MKAFLDLLQTEETLAAVGAALAALLGVFIKSASARKNLVTIASLGYDTVNAFKAQTSTKIDDKAAVALQVMVEKLGRDLTPAEAAVAQEVFESRHTQEQVAKDLAAKLVK